MTAVPVGGGAAAIVRHARQSPKSGGRQTAQHGREKRRRQGDDWGTSLSSRWRRFVRPCRRPRS
jgi:hypothetical protein